MKRPTDTTVYLAMTRQCEHAMADLQHERMRILCGGEGWTFERFADEVSRIGAMAIRMRVLQQFRRDWNTLELRK